MKKALLIIGMILSSFLITNKVYAKSYEVALNGNSTFENEITLTLQIKNQKDLDKSCNGICGIIASLEYDKNKIELVKIESLNDFEIMHFKENGTIVIERNNGAKDNTNIGKFTFKNKTLKNNETTKISLNDLVGTDGESDITTKNISKTIKFIKKTTNNITTDNTVKVETTKSNNNYLKEIAITNLKIDFDKNQLTYILTVKNEIDKININAKAEDEHSTVNGLGEHKLTVGQNKIILLVKAEDNTEREYTLNITRKEKETETEENENAPLYKDETDNNDEKNNDYLVIILPVLVIAIIGTVLLIKRKQ